MQKKLSRKDGDGKHNVDEVLRALSTKRDCRVTGNFIYVLNGEGRFSRSNDLGNGSWGKIDFLVNHKGYKLMWVKDLP